MRRLTLKLSADQMNSVDLIGDAALLLDYDLNNLFVPLSLLGLFCGAMLLGLLGKYLDFRQRKKTELLRMTVSNPMQRN